MNFLIRLLSQLRKSTPANSPEKLRILRATNATRGGVIAVSVEVADSGPRRSKGLLGRSGLLPGQALWIVPCEAVHTFGMQFAIDLIYLDRKHRIRKIRNNVRPWRLSACLSAHSVIELAAGSLQPGNPRVGDILELEPANGEESDLQVP